MRTRDSRLAKFMRPREKTCVQIRVILRFRELCGVYFSDVLDYINIFKNSLHVFCFCKFVLQEQKHVQGYLVLTENIYLRRSEIGC